MKRILLSLALLSAVSLHAVDPLSWGASKYNWKRHAYALSPLIPMGISIGAATSNSKYRFITPFITAAWMGKVVHRLQKSFTGHKDDLPQYQKYSIDAAIRAGACTFFLQLIAKSMQECNAHLSAGEIVDHYIDPKSVPSMNQRFRRQIVFGNILAQIKKQGKATVFIERDKVFIDDELILSDKAVRLPPSDYSTQSEDIRKKDRESTD